MGGRGEHMPGPTAVSPRLRLSENETHDPCLPASAAPRPKTGRKPPARHTSAARELVPLTTADGLVEVRRGRRRSACRLCLWRCPKSHVVEIAREQRPGFEYVLGRGTTSHLSVPCVERPQDAPVARRRDFNPLRQQ